MKKSDMHNINRVVTDIWGSWEQLIKRTQRLMQVAQKHGGNNKDAQFRREIIGSVQMKSEEDHKYAHRAIHIAIGKIEKQERERQQQEMSSLIKDAQHEQEKEERRAQGCVQQSDVKENERILREDHAHFSLK